MADLLRISVAALAGLFGMAAGVVFAFYGTYYLCVAVDMMRGAAVGDGLVTVGWLFCFVTVPLGALLGGSLAFGLVELLLIDRKHRSASQTAMRPESEAIERT